MEFPGEKLVIKLWETVAEKGIGGLFRPWQMRREGRVAIELKRDELLVIAQAERDAEVIRQGGSVPTFVLPNYVPAGEGETQSFQHRLLAIEQRASESVISDTIRREANVTRALLQAEAALESDAQEPPDAKIDDDWLYRWRDSASQVSSEQLQNLWGRVLAGEVKAPGSYSIRTLEFLKNLSKREAETIAKLSQFIVGDSIYREANELLEEGGVTFDVLLSLQQLGVLSGVEALGMSITWKSLDPQKFVQSLISNSLVLVVSGDDPAQTISMPAYMLTETGKQVLSLGTFDSNAKYLEMVGNHLKSQKVSVKIAKFTRVSLTTIRYYEARDL